MHIVTTLSLATVAVAVSGCITGGTRVTNKTPFQLSLKPTVAHSFTSAVLDREKSTLVVFGNVKHRHENKCLRQCYVQLMITSKDGKELRTVGIPIVNRGTQIRGWFGASFRVKLPFKTPPGARVTLSIHDRGCRAGPYFECRPSPTPRRRPPSKK